MRVKKLQSDKHFLESSSYYESESITELLQLLRISASICHF